MVLFGKNFSLENDTIKYPYFQVSLEDSTKVEAVFSVPQYKELKVAVLAVTNCYLYANSLENKIDTLNNRVDTLQVQRDILFSNLTKLEKINNIQVTKIQSLEKALDREQSEKNLIKNTYNLLYLDHTKLQASKTKWKTIALSTIGVVVGSVIYIATN